jgi:hypothetical protein
LKIKPNKLKNSKIFNRSQKPTKSQPKLLNSCFVNPYPLNAVTMSLETLEFIIYPDGRVKEQVTGIVGHSCQEITAAIEAQLGQVVSQEKTADYYQKSLANPQSVTQQTQYSEW